MRYVVMYCRKCGVEMPSYNRESDEGFQRAMNRLKFHIKKEHPRVRVVHRYINWFDRDKPEDKEGDSEVKEDADK